MKEVNKAQTAHEELIPLLCRMVGARDYLELGVYKGDCIGSVSRANPDCHCRGVDNVYRTEQSEVEQKYPNVVMFTADTNEYLETLDESVRFDVVFIDADHSAKAVYKNLTDVWPHVSEHGLVLLHDTYPSDKSFTVPGHCGDGWKIAEQMHERRGMCQDDDMEIVTLPYHPGLTIIRKRSKHLAWGEE